MTEFMCSECGGEVVVYTLTTYPPQTKYQCRKCGRVKLDPPQPREPIAVDMSDPLDGLAIHRRADRMAKRRAEKLMEAR